MKPWSWDPFDKIIWGMYNVPSETLRQLEYAQDQGWAWAYIYRLHLTPEGRQVLESGDIWDARGWDNPSIFADAYRALLTLGMPDGTYIDTQFNPVGWPPTPEPAPAPAPVDDVKPGTRPPVLQLVANDQVTPPPPPAPTTTTAGIPWLPIVAVGAAFLLFRK